MDASLGMPCFIHFSRDQPDPAFRRSCTWRQARTLAWGMSPPCTTLQSCSISTPSNTSYQAVLCSHVMYFLDYTFRVNPITGTHKLSLSSCEFLANTIAVWVTSTLHHLLTSYMLCFSSHLYLNTGATDHGPLAILTRPPPNETPTERVAHEKREPRTCQISDQIDEQLKKKDKAALTRRMGLS